MFMGLKRRYWNLLNAWERYRRPVSISLSPHPWMDGVARNLPKHLDRVVMVDGGAHDGQMALRFARRFPNMEVHAFEPNADLFPKLETNLRDVRGGRHCAALDTKSGQIDLIVNEFAMTSSVLPRADFSERYFDVATRPKETRQVESIALDDWMMRQEVERVDILKLDLQGYEAQALRGATRMLRRGVSCVLLEVNFIPFYEGCSLFADVDSLLRSHGYRLFNLYNVCTHQPEGQIGSADALWVFAGEPAVAQTLKAAA